MNKTGTLEEDKTLSIIKTIKKDMKDMREDLQFIINNWDDSTKRR